MIVVDASVLIKLFNGDEEDYEGAQQIYQKHIDREEQVVIPQFLFTEAANYLATKSHITHRQIKQGLRLLFQAEFIVQSETQDILLEAAVQAQQHKTSVYDMLYAVIAKSKKTKLITADERFKERTKFPFVVLLKDYKKRV